MRGIRALAAALVTLVACNEKDTQAKINDAYARCISKMPPGAEMATRPQLTPKTRVCLYSSTFLSVERCPSTFHR